MRPSLVLSINAVFFFLVGIVFIVAPGPIMSAIGWPETPDPAIVLARDGGVMFTAVGIIDWWSRNAVGTPLLGLLWGNMFIRVIGGGLNLWEFSIGLTPSALGAGIAAALVVDVAFIVILALALRSAYGSRDRA